MLLIGRNFTGLWDFLDMGNSLFFIITWLFSCSIMLFYKFSLYQSGTKCQIVASAISFFTVCT